MQIRPDLDLEQVVPRLEPAPATDEGVPAPTGRQLDTGELAWPPQSMTDGARLSAWRRKWKKGGACAQQGSNLALLARATDAVATRAGSSSCRSTVRGGHKLLLRGSGEKKKKNGKKRGAWLGSNPRPRGARARAVATGVSRIWC